jgi:hypothetical protein
MRISARQSPTIGGAQIAPSLVIAGTALVVAGAMLSAQVRPSNIAELTRHGLQRGTTATVTIVGTNLTDASAIVFDDARLSARIVGHTVIGVDKPRRSTTDTSAPLTDEATRGELTIEITAAPDAPLGDHTLRVRTPLGTTPARIIEVGALTETVEDEPNDERPTTVTLPVTVNGETGWPGDVDLYAFQATAGEQLVFSVEAAGIGSRLDSKLTLRGADGRVVAENDDENSVTRDAVLIHTFAAGGRFTLEVADAAGGGGTNTPYRLTAGPLPYVTQIFPLGGPRDRRSRFTIAGANLGGASTVDAELVLPESTRKAGLAAPPAPADIVPLELTIGDRHVVNDLVAARSDTPEILERDALAGQPTGQPIVLPVTINGRIAPRAGGSSQDTFRFAARKGQRVVFTVAAARVGSPLDATLEVLDALGKPIPRAIVRPVWRTSVDLRDRGSQDPGLRMLSWSDLRKGDYVFVDRELMRVRELPKGPDEDVRLTDFRGRRFSYEGTSGESHALTRPIYKVEIHPPGAKLSPNGLPLFTLHQRNDDGGPFYGKDPYLDFIAPATGEYLVRIRDSRGEGGPAHAYRLTVAPPRPDFTLAVAPANPNVPRGGRVAVTVFAFRHDGFDGPIEVELGELPAGLRATKGVILPGHHQVAVTIEASADAAISTTPLAVHAKAQVRSRTLTRSLDLTRTVAVVSVSPPPPLRVLSVSPAVVELRPGESAQVEAVVERLGGFRKRVPLSVLNLPYFATIPDIGLNGILVTEQQDRRAFTITADERATPLEQTLYVTARAEVNGGEPIEQVSTPIVLRLLPAKPDVTSAASAQGSR